MSELQDASYQGMWRICLLLPPSAARNCFPNPHPTQLNSPDDSVMRYAPHVLSAVNLVEYVPDTLMNSTSSSAMRPPLSKGGPRERPRTLQPRPQRLLLQGMFPSSEPLCKLHASYYGVDDRSASCWTLVAPSRSWWFLC